MKAMKTYIQANEILAYDADRLVGKIEFELHDNVLSILHTYAYESGKGIGSLLMAEAVAYAERNQYTIQPVCSFAQKYLSRQAE